jgi:hypothetical protein
MSATNSPMVRSPNYLEISVLRCARAAPDGIYPADANAECRW